MEENQNRTGILAEQTAALGIDERIARSMEEMGFEKLTPIQEQTIPLLLAGKDVIGQAQTGTGKTAAFGIPLLQRTDPKCRDVQAIVLCPTRELAIQAAEELRRFAKYMHGIKVLPIYGGQDIGRQIQALRNVQIVVGTPGRVMDHMRRHTLKLQTLRMVVLDEADEMLNMGFREDIECILKDVPLERQTALFSATMPGPILEITHTYQKEDAEYVRVTPKELTIPLVKQYYYEIRRDSKDAAAARLLDYYHPKRSLIFCNTKRMVDELSRQLRKSGYQVEGLHGDMSQAQRDRVMYGFRNGLVEILIATDVAARGIDVDDVEAVLNYDVPQDIEYYVHRIGRTGRAGRTGRSFTLVTGRDLYKLRDIERVCRTRIEKRRLPSAEDVTRAKAEKILSQAVEVCREQELARMLPFIEQTLKEENLTAQQLAAAFLRQQMGEEPEDIPEAVRRGQDRSRIGAKAGTNGSRSESRKRGGEKGSARSEGRRRSGEKGSAPGESRRRSGEKGSAPGESRRRGGEKGSALGEERRKNEERGTARAEGRRRNEEREAVRAEGRNRNEEREGGRAEERRKSTEQKNLRGENRKRREGKETLREEKRGKSAGRENALGTKQKSGIGSENGKSFQSEKEKQAKVIVRASDVAEVRMDGSAGKRKRHDHSGQRRQKLITGENRDPGYDTDDFYRKGAANPGRALEIKMREPDVSGAAVAEKEYVPGKESARNGRREQKKNGFLFFRKK